MRKLIVIIAALGLFGVTSQSPVYAASGAKKARAATGDYQTRDLLYLGSKGKKAKASAASPTKVKKTK